jgi:signal transduction histidine kinase
VEAGDAARRRIERDLHDGSQQVLVSLALSLRLAAGRARSTGDQDLAGQLDDAGEQLSRALAELRELARGIHPSVLTEGGLRPALEELAARCPLAVEVDVRLSGTLPDVPAATVYFTVAEALTNAAKHSAGRCCTVTVHQQGDRIELTVTDDGSGGADASGSGLRGVADRVEAVGGRLCVASPAGGGTRVSAVVPLGPAPSVVPEPRAVEPGPTSASWGAGQ